MMLNNDEREDLYMTFKAYAENYLKASPYGTEPGSNKKNARAYLKTYMRSLVLDADFKSISARKIHEFRGLFRQIVDDIDYIQREDDKKGILSVISDISPEFDELLKTSDVAKICNTTDRNVRNWCKEGKLKSIDLNKGELNDKGENMRADYRIEKNELQKFINLRK